MDETWQNSLSESVARAVLARALEDLKEARDRLSQNPSNSSRPPGSMPYWDKSGLEEDEENLDPPRTDAGTNEEAPAAGESSPSVSQDTPAKALSGGKLGKQKGAPGHGRTQKFLIHEVVDHHPMTNNEAERALRHYVISRLISHDTRSAIGSRAFALLARVIETCRRREVAVMDFLGSVITAARKGQPLPQLPEIQLAVA